MQDPYAEYPSFPGRSESRMTSFGAVPAVIVGLDQADAAVGTAAADLLGDIGDPRAIEPLRKAAATGRSGVREAAAGALAKIEGKKLGRG